MKIISFLLLVYFTFDVNAQSPSFSINCKSNTSFYSQISSRKYIIDPQLGFSLRAYKSLNNNIEFFTEIGYQNMSTNYRFQTDLNQLKSSFYEDKTNSKGLLLNIGIQRKWSRFCIGIAPSISYILVNENSYSGSNIIYHQPFEENKDRLRVGYSLASQILLIEGTENKSVWVEPFYNYSYDLSTNYLPSIKRLNVLGIGIIYRIN